MSDKTYENLSRIMEEKGVSMYELERRTGLNASTIRRLMRRDMVGNLHTWAVVCDALEVKLSDIYGGNNGR